MRAQTFFWSIPLVTLITACSHEQYAPPPSEVAVVDSVYVHKYGVAVPPEFWTSSGEHGAVVSVMADGVTVTNSYSAGVLDGETSFSFPHSSQVQKKETYAQGTLLKTTSYYFDGTQKEETVVDNNSGEAITTSWYLNGTPRHVEQYNNGSLVNGEYYNAMNQHDATVENAQGTRIMRDEYGQMVASNDIKNGKLVTSTTYHPNNAPKEKIPYQNDQIHGYKYTFHPAGEPNTVEEWSNGQQQGITTVYQHGEKFAEVPYVNGKKEGVEKRYRDGNVVVKEVSWRNDQLNGPSTTYVGKTATTEWFYKDLPVSKADYNFMMNKPLSH